jgi:hypothetical protein
MDENTNDLQKNKQEIESQISSCYSQVAKYSAHLSNIFRQLAFAEGALFWFSKLHLNASDLSLMIGFSVLIVYFILDAIQYFVGLVEYERLAKKFHDDYKKNKIYDTDNYEMESL